MTLVLNKRGAPHGKVYGRYDLLPWEALEKAAIIMERNVETHGEDTWRGLDRREHVNHALAHLGQFLRGQDDEDHLAHALCRVLFACSRLAEDEELRMSEDFCKMMESFGYEKEDGHVPPEEMHNEEMGEVFS